jgi:hypothetical protein
MTIQAIDTSEFRDFAALPILSSPTGHLFATEGQGFSRKIRRFKSEYGLALPNWLDRFTNRVFGLFAFSLAQIAGPSGMHGQFLERNIESATIDLGLPTFAFGADEPVEIEAVLQTVLTILQLQSRLHEELHHSLFYYMLMGQYEFVGLPEYGFSLLLMLLSILAAGQSMGVRDEEEVSNKNIASRVREMRSCSEKNLGNSIDDLISM